MLRRIFAIVLIVLGLGTAGAAVASGTVWRPSEVVTATLPQEPEVPVVIAGGNVLATVNPEVTVTLTASSGDTPLVLAMGREADVRAWLADAPYLEVTGLTDWETLSVQAGPAGTEDATEDPSADATDGASADASAEPTEDATEDASDEPTESATSGAEDSEEAPADATVPDPAGSDLWIEEVTGTGELSYDWSQVEGRWMMLVATDGSQPAPAVSMTWTREVTTPLVVPGLIVGGVLFLIGLVWLVIELLVHREERRARRRSAAPAEEAPAVATTAEDGTPLTRRQIREAARAASRKGTPEAAAAAGTATRSAERPTPQTPSTPPTGTATTDEPGEGPSDWTAIITGATEPADETQPADPESHAPGADEEPVASTPSPVSGATDLDDWVRSGRTGEQAGPVSTYESPAPGRGLGDVRSDDAATSWTGTPGATQTPADPADADEDKPRRWWQRRKNAEPPSSADQPSATAAPTGPDPAGDEPVPTPAPDAADEHSSQASGASWRQTWGLTTTTGTQPETDEDGPESTGPATDDEEGGER